jgi:type IX secretion system PorP/SprF family membrane protein
LNSKRLHYFVLFLTWTIASNTWAQDIHFSQFYNAPQNLNPALTGAFAEDIRFIANYRRQWASVPVPYLTFSGAFDTKVYNKIAPNGFFAFGGVFNYDRQGTSALRWSQLALNAAYTHQLSDEQSITAGFQLGTVNRRFRLDDLTFENQFNGDIFDPASDSRERFEQSSRTFLDLGFGLNFYTRSDAGFRLNIGAGLFHLTRPAQNFYNQTDAELPFRWTGHLGGLAPLADKVDLRFRLLGHFQGVYQEFLIGTAAIYKLSEVRSKELFISFGTNFRYGSESDAIIPTLGLKYGMWYAEFSYDINISDFEVATNGAGGPELALIYTIAKVKPPPVFKACPIF